MPLRHGDQSAVEIAFVVAGAFMITPPLMDLAWGWVVLGMGLYGAVALGLLSLATRGVRFRVRPGSVRFGWGLPRHAHHLTLRGTPQDGLQLWVNDQPRLHVPAGYGWTLDEADAVVEGLREVSGLQLRDERDRQAWIDLEASSVRAWLAERERRLHTNRYRHRRLHDAPLQPLVERGDLGRRVFVRVLYQGRERIEVVLTPTALEAGTLRLPRNAIETAYVLYHVDYWGRTSASLHVWDGCERLIGTFDRPDPITAGQIRALAKAIEDWAHARQGSIDDVPEALRHLTGVDSQARVDGPDVPDVPDVRVVAVDGAAGETLRAPRARDRS